MSVWAIYRWLDPFFLSLNLCSFFSSVVPKESKVDMSSLHHPTLRDFLFSGKPRNARTMLYISFLRLKPETKRRLIDKLKIGQ